MSDEEFIESRRRFLRGITKPDDWVDRLCDLAINGLYSEANDLRLQLEECRRCFREYQVLTRREGKP